ncbi:MAG TPA: thioredoxin domain-containing protein [Mycobacteriales bacterium]|nr:thioredoxin domain-containing protein [Mycobacteriales bacterium]
MSNRLAESTSPYLLQHQDNPVDWWEWEPAAFDEARRRNVPVLLSVGYAACHWCHVMAHESFEDTATAEQMNEQFVCIKVDREERPDVDAVYMEATQAMTGHGGWPMTVFMTADGEPFFTGTYFPPADRHGMPSFRRLMTSITEAWRERPDELTESAKDIVRRLADRGPAAPSAPLDAAMLDAAAASLRASYDDVHGGFGGAPKFPPSMCLEFLLRHHSRTGDETSLAMVERTCERMARGGMYDQLGGGFARYSVDGQWVVPHFEKMLYDNALLCRVYLHLWRATGSELAKRIALETADFLVRDLRTPEGGFSSALDADSEGVEGKFYAWTPEQLIEVLGEDDGAWVADFYAVGASGSFEHGTSVLQRLGETDDRDRLESVRARLWAAREQRVHPALDDKVVAAWNGLAIAALAETGFLLDRPDLVAAAETAADLLRDLHWDGATSRLLRTSRQGRPSGHVGVLEDYGDVAEGLLALYAVTGDPRRVDGAAALLDVVLERFSDGAGGFFDTADDAETLVRRPQDPTDNATPSGSSAAAAALLSYAALSGSTRHRAAAEGALAGSASLLSHHARFVGWAAAAGEALLAGPAEVAIVGPATPARDALQRAALASMSPGVVVAVETPAVAGHPPVALLADRPMVDGRPTAYVCRHFTCAAPVTDPAELAAQLRRPSAE